MHQNEVEDTMNKIQERNTLSLAVILDRINAISFIAIILLSLLVFVRITTYISVALFATLTLTFLISRLYCSYITMIILKYDIGVEFDMVRESASFLFGLVIIGSVSGAIYHFSPLSDIVAISVAAPVFIIGVTQVLSYSLEINNQEVFISIGS